MICNDDDVNDTNDGNDTGDGDDTDQKLPVSGPGRVQVLAAVCHAPFISVNAEDNSGAAAGKMTITFMFQF